MTLHKSAQDGEADAATSGPAFAMPQALVILGFLTAAVVLRLSAHMTVQDIVVLLTVAGTTSVAVLLAVGIHSRRGGHSLLRRMLKAALTSASGN